MLRPPEQHLPITVAYLILAHENPEQLASLVEALPERAHVLVQEIAAADSNCPPGNGSGRGPEEVIRRPPHALRVLLHQSPLDKLQRLRIAGVVFVFLWFFIGGIAHRAVTDTEMRTLHSLAPSG
jgi:hypothetical protein